MSRALGSFLVLLALSLVQQADQGQPPLPNHPLTLADCQPLARSTPDQLRDRLGLAPHISRQVLYHRVVEQWTYDNPWMVRVEIDYPRGRQPRVLSVQPISLPRP
jgi:hypothetical protein